LQEIGATITEDNVGQLIAAAIYKTRPSCEGEIFKVCSQRVTDGGFYFLMIRSPPRSTRNVTPYPYTTRYQSQIITLPPIHQINPTPPIESVVPALGEQDIVSTVAEKTVSPIRSGDVIIASKKSFECCQLERP
jgi:hypothetical protein